MTEMLTRLDHLSELFPFILLAVYVCKRLCD